MARIVLFVIAAVALGGVVFGLSAGDKAHTLSQQRALVRETLDDAVAMVLDEAIHPSRRAWINRSPFRDPFDVNGHEVELTEYQLEDDGQVAKFTLVARVGGAVVEQTSRYLLEQPGWPGPLWFDTPVAVAEVDPDARIDGATRFGTRGPLYDASRFNAYRLDTVLDLGQITRSLNDSLALSRGTLGPLTVHQGTRALLDEYDAPSPTEVVGRALSEFDRDTDIRLRGPITVTDEREFGDFNSDGDSRIVHVKGDLTIGPTGDVEGGGLLFVEGNLRVEGRLRWGGLVVVRSQEQALDLDLDRGDVEIRGSLVVDHEAPPPGGHTDMTVLRDLSGSWSPRYGQYGPGTPGYITFGGNYPFYDHQHRIDHVVPEGRTFYMAERGRDRHEGHTWFRRTLTDIASRYPGENVYVRFRNPQNHGAALFQMAVGDSTYAGAVVNGFGSASRQGDRWASRSFAPADLDTFVVDVQSLRMLTHLTDRQEPSSPYWPWPGSICQSRPICLGYMNDRDAAMAVQIVRDLTDAVLYEAAIYWHTHPPGYPEFEQERAADDAWRAAILAGTADYGTALSMGADVKLLFERGQVTRILNRLRFNELRLVHVGSFVQDRSSQTPTGPNPGSPPPTSPTPPSGPPANPMDPNGPGEAVVCHNGAEQSVPRSRILHHIFHGDTVGGCADDPPQGHSPNNIVVCHNGQSVAVTLMAYHSHIDHGDTYGSCP